MKEIPIYKKGEVVAVALVSDEDFDYLNQWVWRTERKYCVRGQRIDGKFCQIRMHRVVMERLLGAPMDNPDYVVDHIDGNPRNNQRENLRVATSSQNAANKAWGESNTGIRFDRNIGLWRARIQTQNRSIYIGAFPTREEAEYYRKMAQEQLHGEFIRRDALQQATKKGS